MSPAEDPEIKKMSSALCQDYLHFIRGSILADKSSEEGMPALANSIEDELTTNQLEMLHKNPHSLIPEIELIIIRILQSNSSIRRLLNRSRFKGRSIKTNKPLKVFLSYRRSVSVDFVSSLASKLNTSKSILAEYDESILTVGDFPVQLGNRIRQCDILVLVIEPKTLKHIADKNNFIRRELLTAVISHVPVLPLLVDADGVLNEVEWPQEIVSVAEQQAVTYKRTFADLSLQRLQQSILRLSEITRRSK